MVLQKRHTDGSHNERGHWVKGVTTAATGILDLVSLLPPNCDGKFLREERGTMTVYLPVQPGSGWRTRVREHALSEGGGDNPMAVHYSSLLLSGMFYCVICAQSPAFKPELPWYLLGTLLSRPYLFKHQFSNFPVRLESLSKQGWCWAPARGFWFSGSGGGPSICISNKLSRGCCWCWSGKHTLRTYPKKKVQSCSSGNILAVSQLPNKACALCASFTAGKALTDQPSLPWDQCHQLFWGEGEQVALRTNRGSPSWDWPCPSEQHSHLARPGGPQPGLWRCSGRKRMHFHLRGCYPSLGRGWSRSLHSLQQGRPSWNGVPPEEGWRRETHPRTFSASVMGFIFFCSLNTSFLQPWM